MIRILLLLLAFFLFQDTYTQQLGFNLKGYIEGLRDNSRVYLTKNLGSDTVGVTISQNGRFSFKGKVPHEAEFYFIFLDTTVTKKKGNAILLINSKIEVKTTINKWPAWEDVNGSEPHNEYKNILTVNKHYQIQTPAIVGELSQLVNSMMDARNSNDTLLLRDLTNRKNQLESDLASINSQKNTELLNFIEKHRNSLYVPWLIMKLEKELGFSKVVELYEGLSQRSKLSYYGIQLKERIKGSELEVGSTIGDFIGISPDGREITLQQVIKSGKYTLLDFWASWCTPCRKENPTLKEIYSKYHSLGFNILSVTSDINTQRWKKAIEEDGLPWYNIIDKEKNGGIAKMYNIGALPTYYLIDSTGKILAGDNALKSNSTSLRGEDLEKKLNELFATN